MLICGYILSIPVFGDSTFIMLNPISKSLSIKSKVPYAATAIAVALGATASHSLVPPTPGPIATAGILDADLGMIIFWGIIVSLTAMVPAYFFIKNSFQNSFEPIMAEIDKTGKVSRPPSATKSFLPVIVPLVLIILASIAKYPSKPFGDGEWVSIIEFVGSPVIALLLGAIFVLFTSHQI